MNRPRVPKPSAAQNEAQNENPDKRLSNQLTRLSKYSSRIDRTNRATIFRGRGGLQGAGCYSEPERQVGSRNYRASARSPDEDHSLQNDWKGSGQGD